LADRDAPEIAKGAAGVRDSLSDRIELSSDGRLAVLVARVHRRYF
jgi:hypothetical protein